MSKIDKIIDNIKDIFANDSTGHDYWHSVRVYKNALRILEKEGIYSSYSKELVSYASLLHDVDDPKLFCIDGDNDFNKYINAKNILNSLNVDKDTINKVVHIIDQVSYKGIESVIPDTVEGKIVQDADRLDSLGAIGIGRTFAYGGAKGRYLHNPDLEPLSEMNRLEYLNNRGSSINHFYEKLFKLKDMMNTQTAKDIAEKRDAYMREYIDVFMSEWEGI